MKFQLLGDFPAGGNVFITAGTVIDGNDPQWAGVPMPLNAKALDVEAANFLIECHPHNQHLLHFASGIAPTLRINV